MRNYEKHLLQLLCAVVLTFAFFACSIPFEKGEGKPKSDASAIPAPQNVTAQTKTTSRIDLAWQADAAATTYSVYRSTEEGSGYAAIATLKETAYADEGVAANAAYFYYITLSINNRGESGKSATVQADTKPPMPPESISAVEFATNITVTWQPAAAAESYKVYRAIGQDSEYAAITPEPITETSYPDEAVSLGNDYYYRVTSLNNCGEGEQSAYAISSVHTPAPPESIRTSIESATKITVTWLPVAAAESYRVYRSNAQDNEYTAMTPEPITETGYADETVSLNNDYYYKISSVNRIGEGEKSVYAKGSVKEPDAPQGLTTAPASASSIKLAWDAVNEVTGYKVYKSITGSDGAYTEQARVTDTSWIDTGLVMNTSYYYKVEAVNGVGQTMSAFVEGEITLFTAPLNVQATEASSTSIKVQWTAVNGAAGYKVYTSSSSGGEYSLIGSPTTNNFTHTGLTAEQSYFYKVSAVGIAGEGTKSAFVEGKIILVMVTTLARSGTFNNPSGVAVDAAGNIYVADSFNYLIRKITLAGVVTTLAGSGTSGFANGTGTAAQFECPVGVALDATGAVYVADSWNHRIRKITPAGVVTTFAGSGTEGYVNRTGTAARFAYPFDVALDATGAVYVADASNNRIRKITPSGVVTTLAGSIQGYADGTGTEAQFYYLEGVAVDAAGIVYVADTSNNRIRKITPAGAVTTLAGSTAGYADGTGAVAQFYLPYGVAVDAEGTVYVADTCNNRIRKITPAGVVTTLAGSTRGYADGTGSAAQFYLPYGVAVDAVGTVYVADTGNNRIRKITQ
jgi:fibronectin type 3 domain-containing protein/sugar lactone lactonase YvrE